VVARRAIAATAGLAAREAALAPAVRQGLPVSQVMGGDYERLLRRPRRTRTAER